MPKRTARVGPWSKAQLDKLIERATVDAFNEDEQRVGLFTMMEGSLGLPFETQVLGVDVIVEAIDLTISGEIVAICRHGRSRQRIPVLDLPLPSPLPTGTKWIEAYRRWCGADRDRRHVARS